MKTCDEMVNSLLERREQFLWEQKLKRRNTLGIVYAGGSCALTAAIIGAGIYNSGVLSENQPLDPDISPTVSDGLSSENTPQAPDFSSVIWAEGEHELDEIHTWVDYEMSDFYGKRIFPSISEAFEKYGDEEVFAIAAVCGYYDMNFVYNGKTLAQYEAEEKELWERCDFLYVLQKIIYYKEEDEALHGDKNSAYYDQQISELPEDIRKEYIVDGVFLKDKAEKDMNDTKEKCYAAKEAYEQARHACNEHKFETAAEQITAQGIYCETLYSSDGSDSPYSLVIFATKDEFAALTFDGMQKWVFAMANKIVINGAYMTGPYISTSD